MKTFDEFILENTDWLASRNSAVDIDSVVKSMADSWREKMSSKISDDDIKNISTYIKKMKTLSLNKMDDMFGNDRVSNGLLKAIIAAVKKAFDEAGYSKAGAISPSQSRAGKIDSFLKQKHIGPIVRR